MQVYNEHPTLSYNSNLFKISTYLIIEDNKIISAHLKRQFEKENLICTLVANCFDAYNNACDTHYDMILCDVNLPDGNGKDVIKKIRANKACKSHASKVAFLTADETQISDLEIEEMKICAVFLKPIKPKDFFKRLKNILNHEKIEGASADESDNTSANLFEKNLSKLFSNQNTLNEVLEDLVAQLEKSLPNLEKCMATKNFNAIYTISHKVKPSLELLKINTLAECFHNLEKFSKLKNADEIEKWFNALKHISRNEILKIKTHIV